MALSSKEKSLARAKAEYDSAVEKAKAEYHARVEAIEWLCGEPKKREPARNASTDMLATGGESLTDVLTPVREAVASIHGEFDYRSVQKLIASHGLILKDRSVSAALKRLVDTYGELELVAAGVGRRPAKFRRRVERAA
ncbi:MAG: hypothetical protein AB7G11_17680 [Phycisphaerales bacterium]